MKKLNRLEVILLIIILIQIIGFIFIYSKIESHKTIVDNTLELEKELPKQFNNHVQEILLDKIRTRFNKQEYQEMYDLFSDWAKLHFQVSDIEKEFIRLHIITGNIVEYEFSYHEFDGQKEGADWYTVYYKTRYERGLGDIKLTLRVIGSNWELTQVNVSIE